jgi:hypothetical protein
LIRRIVNEVLVALDCEFTKLYADTGRPSIPPERLLQALRLQAFYTIRSETQLPPERLLRALLLQASPFGWGKTIGGLARPMLRGVARLRFKFILTMAAYDLIRLPKLMAASA